MHITLQPAFVLHHRPYRETSLLLDVFTQEFGRVALVARGVRRKRSALSALLQPFMPLLISWQGKNDLMTLRAAESNGLPLGLKADALLSGFYLNELLVRLLHKYDPHPKLYTIYHETLLELRGIHFQQKTLRIFEKKLLAELGYGLQLEKDKNSFDPEEYYRFCPEFGFKQCENQEKESAFVFSGKNLLAFAADEFDEKILQDAKRLMRIALGSLLGTHTLHSRKLFLNVSTTE